MTKSGRLIVGKLKLQFTPIVRYTVRMTALPTSSGKVTFSMCTIWLSMGLGLLAQTSEVVELPPYVVAENSTIPWRYAEFPGVEFISRCPDAVTRQLITSQYRLHELLGLIIPRELRMQWDNTRKYVYFNESNQPAVNQEMVESIEKQERLDAKTKQSKHRADADLEVGFMPNFRFWDEDSIAVFFVIDPTDQDQDGITLANSYVRYLLESRTPALSRWFIEGMMELYGSMRFTEPPIKGQIDSVEVIENSAVVAAKFRNAVTVEPVFWISDQKTKALKKNTKSELKLLSLAEIFAVQLIETKPADYQQQWRAQSSLFIRWALDPEKGTGGGGLPNNRTQALWKFLERSSVEAVTETLFQECFGLSYAATETALRDYMPSALRTAYSLRTEQPIVTPTISLRNATPLEVSLVKGELNRLEIGYVRARYPAITDTYIEQARRTLRRSYDLGDRDPRLLAALGLCECDALNDVTALPFLQAATAAKVVRPRAYYEQARIELKLLITSRGEIKPTVKDLGNILKLLGTARKQSPAQVDVYELYAKLGLRSEMLLSKAMDDVLNEGLRLFPRNFRLINAVAILKTMHGRIDEVRILITRGFAVTANPSERAKLEHLLSAITPDPEGEQ
jgi:hypothetical protein